MRDSFAPIRFIRPRAVSAGALFLALMFGFADLSIADPGTPRAAVFNFELIDTSLEGSVKGINDNETKRLVLISDMLREKLSESGRYEIADISHLQVQIEEAGYLHSCNGCESKIAAQAEAQVAVTGVVQKVSNLILNINVYFHDVESGKLIRSASADIRGNTDESWAHGISWLARNRLLKP